MKSRERVLTTIHHQEPDKVPIDFGAMRSTGIMAIAYNRLKQHLGIKSGRIRVYDVMQQLAEVEPEIMDLFQLDVVDIENTSVCPDARTWKPYILPDGTSTEMRPDVIIDIDSSGNSIAKNLDGTAWGRMPKGCLYFEPIQPELGAPHLPVKEYRLPIFTDEFLERMHNRAKYLYENTDYALLAHFGGNILENGQMMRGWGNFMMDLADGSGFAEEMIAFMVEQHLVNLKNYLAAVGDYIQIIQMGDDLGTQKGPQVSLPSYEKYIYPAHKAVYSYVKEKYPQVKLYLHSCGSIEIYLNLLIEAGVEILNPVQTSAKNMDPVELKKKYGKQLTFWGGGCDTQAVLPNATPEEIDAHVHERMQILAPGGGFVFTQIHNVQADIKPENIVALYKAANKYRNYPIC